MGCFLVLFALISPRLALFFVLVFSNWVAQAFDGGWILPVLGFFLLPWTTLAYVVMWEVGSGVNGFAWFIVIFAFVMDVLSYSRTSQARARQRSAGY
ncbi:MAG: hypothetical protein JJE10_05590 [Thermoleophilia bacterium]|nr:hypothetical protein [Thermoleophilia bacterium]